MLTGRGVLIPTVVAELMLGVVIGPQVLGLHVTEMMTFFADLGLGMLFFFAGYEIDLHRIAGCRCGSRIAGWVLSLLIAYASADCWPRRGSCSHCSTPGRRWPRRRSAR